jgi:hypothetical protein
MTKLLFLLMLLPFIVYGQEDEEYLGYIDKEKIIHVTQLNKQISNKANKTFTILGHVILKINGTKIYCDSAILDYKKFVLSAYGNVIVCPSSELEFYTSYINLDTRYAKILGIDGRNLY